MKIVSYIRVSTKAQGNSGLGLEAQQATVASFGKERQARILAEYREVETGKRKDREELAKALATAAARRLRWWWPSWTGWPGMWRSRRH